MSWLFSNTLCSVVFLLEKCVCKEKVLGSVTDFCQMKYAYGKWVMCPQGMILSLCCLCMLLADSREELQNWQSHEIRGRISSAFFVQWRVQLLIRAEQWIAYFIPGSLVSPFHFHFLQQECYSFKSAEWLTSRSRINDKSLASNLPLLLHSLCRLKRPRLLTENVFNTVGYEHLVHTITWRKEGFEVWCACVMTQQSLLVGPIWMRLLCQKVMDPTKLKEQKSIMATRC